MSAFSDRLQATPEGITGSHHAITGLGQFLVQF